MIGDDDYRFITEFLSSDGSKRDTLLEEQRGQCAKTFLSLLEHISKDQTVQYILTIMDDMMQVIFQNVTVTFFLESIHDHEPFDFLIIGRHEQG